MKIAFENNRLAVIANARPQHSPIFELGDLPPLAIDIVGPDVLRAAPIGNVIDGAVVFAPHRPRLFGAAFADLFVLRCRTKAH